MPYIASEPLMVWNSLHGASGCGVTYTAHKVEAEVCLVAGKHLRMSGHLQPFVLVAEAIGEEFDFPASIEHDNLDMSVDEDAKVSRDTSNK